MKKIILLLSTIFFTFGCASKTPKPKYVDEKNEAKFSQTRTVAEAPETVLRAARNVLDELTKGSDPQAPDAVNSENDAVSTGWIYGLAKDKYVQYDYNGTPRRKQLALRRIYGFTVNPTLAGSQVSMKIEEEIQDIDMKTGAPKNWKSVPTDPAAYDMMLRRLREEIRAQ